MNEKKCSNCRFSYAAQDFSGRAKGQNCSSQKYNSPDYTNEMLMEDWNKGHCRFWEAKERGEGND